MKARIRWIAAWLLLACGDRDWYLTDDERSAYDAYMAKAGTDDDQAAWDALPLWMRVTLCGECGWLDAVFEANPGLGREINERVHGVTA